MESTTFAANIAPELAGDYQALLKRNKYVDVVLGESDRPGMVRITARFDENAKGTGRAPKKLTKKKLADAAEGTRAAYFKSVNPGDVLRHHEHGEISVLDGADGAVSLAEMNADGWVPVGGPPSIHEIAQGARNAGGKGGPDVQRTIDGGATSAPAPAPASGPCSVCGVNLELHKGGTCPSAPLEPETVPAPAPAPAAVDPMRRDLGPIKPAPADTGKVHGPDPAPALVNCPRCRTAHAAPLCPPASLRETLAGAVGVRLVPADTGAPHYPGALVDTAPAPSPMVEIAGEPLQDSGAVTVEHWRGRVWIIRAPDGSREVVRERLAGVKGWNKWDPRAGGFLVGSRKVEKFREALADLLAG